MNDDARSASVGDVLSLSTKVAERLLHAQSAGPAPSVNELEAVVKAAEFLHAHNVPWPAVVSEVIDGLVAQMEGVRAQPGDAKVCLPPFQQPSCASSRGFEGQLKGLETFGHPTHQVETSTNNG